MDNLLNIPPVPAEPLGENIRSREETRPIGPDGREARVVTLSADGRDLLLGKPITILEDGFETPGTIGWIHPSGEIDAWVDEEVLLANHPRKLDRLAFGRDWRWPAERPSPATTA